MEKSRFCCVYKKNNRFATVNSVPGEQVYAEKLIKEDNREYRMWDPHRSKLCGAMKKGLNTFPFKEGSRILYLGASYGTTVSHLCDIVGRKGEIYAVEMAPQCMNDLFRLCEKRDNLIPIHADARKPSEYAEVGEVEIIYQDVAQPDQDEIMLKNAKMFLAKGGIAMIAIKSQSIDVTKSPEAVFAIVLERLEPAFELIEKIKLEPYDKDHLFAVLRYLG